MGKLLNIRPIIAQTCRPFVLATEGDTAREEICERHLDGGILYLLDQTLFTILA